MTDDKPKEGQAMSIFSRLFRRKRLEREVHAPALPDDYEVKRAEHDSTMWRLYYRGNWAAEVCEGAAFMYGHLPVAALRALFDAAERGRRSDDTPDR